MWKKKFCWYSHLASELWSQSNQSLLDLSVIFASSVCKEQQVGRHLGVEQTYSRLRTEEGNTHSKTTTEIDFLIQSYCLAWDIFIVLLLFHTVTTCWSSRTATLFYVTVESRGEMTPKCGGWRVLGCLVAPVCTTAGSSVRVSVWKSLGGCMHVWKYKQILEWMRGYKTVMRTCLGYLNRVINIIAALSSISRYSVVQEIQSEVKTPWSTDNLKADL